MRLVTKALLAVLPLAGCSGISPGDYVIYRIAFAQSEQSTDCFPEGEDPDDADDSTTFRTGETYAIFSSGDGTLLLDFGDGVLEGSREGGVSTFTGTDIDVEYFGDGDASRTTYTQTLTVSIDGSGASVTGTAENAVDQACSGADCGGFDTFSCTTTTAFVGTRVDKVDLEHSL